MVCQGETSPPTSFGVQSHSQSNCFPGTSRINSISPWKSRWTPESCLHPLCGPRCLMIQLYHSGLDAGESALYSRRRTSRPAQRASKSHQTARRGWFGLSHETIKSRLSQNSRLRPSSSSRSRSPKRHHPPCPTSSSAKQSSLLEEIKPQRH